MCMKYTIIALLVVLAFLQYKFWFDEGNVNDIADLRQKVALQKSSLHDSQRHNRTMAEHIQMLKHNEEMVEHLARKELGMTKPDESYYQILEK